LFPFSVEAQVADQIQQWLLLDCVVGEPNRVANQLLIRA
jgi:hypothetical protein